VRDKRQREKVANHPPLEFRVCISDGTIPFRLRVLPREVLQVSRVDDYVPAAATMISKEKKKKGMWKRDRMEID
jgi:hypothetical protein